MVFVKGQSGNPQGRRKEDPELIKLTMPYTSMAIERLVHWAKSDNPKASVAASIHILDRAYGKATEFVNIAMEIMPEARAYPMGLPEREPITIDQPVSVNTESVLN
jgi:hypothetical protein